jgi:hypothetical protein
VLGYSNPKLDEIIDLEQQTFDVKKREKLLWMPSESSWKMRLLCRYGIAWIYALIAPTLSGARHPTRRFNSRTLISKPDR